MFKTIKSAQAGPDYTVEIEWEDGSRSVVDFASTVKKGGVFSALADKEFFINGLSVGGDGVWLTWPGELDFSADSLWHRCHPDQETDEISAAQ